MIYETIISTTGSDGYVHLAPMGVHVHGDNYIIMPFRPSTTLQHITDSGFAILNHTDDVRVFAGCLTGHRDWSLSSAHTAPGQRLQDCLAHIELQLQDIEDDSQRPKLHCKIIHQQTHRPFSGFNRAQFAVLEAAILTSRLNMLPWDKIQSELDYLKIGLDKCAGERELEAWGWLMETIEAYQSNNSTQDNFS